ncbi:MAG: twin-arginine translocase TatA/TatE family subunit [Alphaproteobacteria bacterium]|nr:twin-arginine translocase TatA/TatE family subunit [Alphaproteobacteria bacterium]
MGAFSIWHWLIVLAVVLVLFGGGGKLSRLMGDFGKGLKSFKKQMKNEDEEQADGKSIENDTPESVDAQSSAKVENDTATKS